MPLNRLPPVELSVGIERGLMARAFELLSRAFECLRHGVGNGHTAVHPDGDGVDHIVDAGHPDASEWQSEELERSGLELCHTGTMLVRVDGPTRPWVVMECVAEYFARSHEIRGCCRPSDDLHRCSVADPPSTSVPLDVLNGDLQRSSDGGRLEG